MTFDLDTAALNHIGITVRSVDDALAFWTKFLGREQTWRRTLDGTYLSEITGYPGLVLDGSLIELTSGVYLELLDYKVNDKSSNDMATANPGNVHVCLTVQDIEEAWSRALDSGARPISESPVHLNSGPNVGSRAGYLRIHDEVTLELVQRASPGRD